MYLSRYLILTLFVICYFGINYVNANAGLIVPVPKDECSPNSHHGCKNKRPCHDGDTENKDVNPIYINDEYDIGIFQLDAMPTTSDKSTYTLLYFPSGTKDVSIQLLTFNQKTFKDDNTTIKVTMPPIAENSKFKKIEGTFDKATGYSYGIVELTFDAREDPTSEKIDGRVFYSCARVRLQKKPYKSHSDSEIKVDTTLTIEDTISGNAIADHNETTIVIPKLVAHNSDGSASASLGNKDPNGDLKTNDDEEEHAGNNSNSLIAPFTLITLLSLVCSLLKL